MYSSTINLEYYEKGHIRSHRFTIRDIEKLSIEKFTEKVFDVIKEHSKNLLVDLLSIEFEGSHRFDKHIKINDEVGLPFEATKTERHKFDYLIDFQNSIKNIITIHYCNIQKDLNSYIKLFRQMVDDEVLTFDHVVEWNIETVILRHDSCSFVKGE